MYIYISANFWGTQFEFAQKLLIVSGVKVHGTVCSRVSTFSSLLLAELPVRDPLLDDRLLLNL